MSSFPERVWLYRVGGEDAVLEVGRVVPGPMQEEAEYLLESTVTARIAELEARAEEWRDAAMTAALYLNNQSPTATGIAKLVLRDALLAATPPPPLDYCRADHDHTKFKCIAPPNPKEEGK